MVCLSVNEDLSSILEDNERASNSENDKSFKDNVYTMPTHFENGEKCEDSKILADIHKMPA